jgi:small conductance mechanosensitive channel
MLFQTVPIEVGDVVDVADVTGQDVLKAVAVVVISVIVAMISKRYIRKWLESLDGVPKAAADAIARATGYLIVFVGVLFALPLLGFQSQPVLLVILAVALLLFFAGKPLMESFTAGIILQARSPFLVGELIKHEDHIGTVIETNGRTTVISTPTGERVAIPNVSMLSHPISNLSHEGARRTTVNVGVAYGTDLDAAVDVIVSTVTGLDTVLKDPAPMVGVAEYHDSAIRIQVWCWHLPSLLDEFLARDEIVRFIDRALRSAGIVIAFPQMDVWMKDPSPDTPNDMKST